MTRGLEVYLNKTVRLCKQHDSRQFFNSFIGLSRIWQWKILLCDTPSQRTQIFLASIICEAFMRCDFFTVRTLLKSVTHTDLAIAQRPASIE